MGSLELLKQMMEIGADPQYRSLVVKVSESLQNLGVHQAPLTLAADAIADGSRWKDVVWALLGDGAPLSDEGQGVALLDFGLNVPEYAPGIGRACNEILDDPRIPK